MSRERTSRFSVRSVGRFALFGLIAYFVVRFVIELLGSQKSLPLRLHPGALAVSAVVLVAYYLLFAGGTMLVLRRMGSKVAFIDAFTLNYMSNLGKYLPGGVWPVVGRFALADRAGVDPSHAVIAAVLENVCSSIAGIAVFAGTLGLGGARAIGLPVWVPALVAVGSLGMLHPMIFGRIVALALKLTKSEVEAPHVPFGVVLQLVGYYVVTWLVVGVAFMLYVRSIVVGGQPSDALLYVGAYAAASVGGLLVLFAPGGLGVRESILGILLAPIYGLTIAGAIGVSARLWSTAVEIVLSVIAVTIFTHRAKRHMGS